MPLAPIPSQLGPPQGGQAAPPLGPTGPTSPPTMAGLLGAPTEGGASEEPTSPEDHVQSLLQQFRALSMAVQALARQYPAAGQDLAVANDALINAMTKVVSSLSAESSSAPQVLM